MHIILVLLYHITSSEQYHPLYTIRWRCLPGNQIAQSHYLLGTGFFSGGSFFGLALLFTQSSVSIFL